MKRSIFIIMAFWIAFNFNIFAEVEHSTGNKKQGETKELVYNADSFRDPFLPRIKKEELEKKQDETTRVSGAGEPEPQMPQIAVQGMVWNTEKPQAIIDGQVFKIGDKIKEAQIIEINSDGVKFIIGSKIFTLKPMTPYDKKR